MLKLLKWIYSLSQQHERKRIEGILREQYSVSRITMDYGENSIEVNAKVDQVINNIINEIVQPNRFEQNSYTLLYPNGDKDNV